MVTVEYACPVTGRTMVDTYDEVRDAEPRILCTQGNCRVYEKVANHTQERVFVLHNGFVYWTLVRILA